MIKLYRQFDLFFQLILLIVLSAALVYYIPASVNRIVFLLFFIPVWYTKNDFFWLTFLFVVLGMPGGLFSGGTVDDQYRLPIYNLAPGVSFAFQELYIIIIFIKAIIKGNTRTMFRDFPYKWQLMAILMLLVSLVVVSFALGTSINSLRNLYKNLISLSLFYSIIYVFQKHEDVVNFFKALFPFAFVAILLQVYGILSGQQLIALFKPYSPITQGVLTGDLLRPIEMSVVLLACSFGSFFFMGNRDGPFAFPYLILINIIAFTGIIITATRSWFLGFSAMYIFFIVLNYRRSGSVILKYFAGIMVFTSIVVFIPLLGDQIRDAFTRYDTITYLAAGDPTAGGTLSRLTERAPRIMEGYLSSTIILGAGYSDLYYKYADGHLGFNNILLQSGIVGLIIFLWFAVILVLKPLRLSRKSVGHPCRDILRNLPLLIPAIMIINSGTQFWGFEIDDSRALLLAAYISISGFYIKTARNSLFMNGMCVAKDEILYGKNSEVRPKVQINRK